MTDNPQQAGLSPEEIGTQLGLQLELLRGFVRRRAGRSLLVREGLSDVVQSTLREVIEDGSSLSFPDPEALRGHVYRVAAHKIVSKARYHSALRRDPLRERGIDSSCEDDQDPHGEAALSPSGLAMRREDLERLSMAIDELDPRDREILVLRRLLGVPAADVARELGLAESTLRWRLGVVLSELAARLGA